MNKIRIGVWVCGDYLTHATRRVVKALIAAGCDPIAADMTNLGSLHGVYLVGHPNRVTCDEDREFRDFVLHRTHLPYAIWADDSRVANLVRRIGEVTGTPGCLRNPCPTTEVEESMAQPEAPSPRIQLQYVPPTGFPGRRIDPCT